MNAAAEKVVVEPELNRETICFRRSWSWSAPEFADEFSRLMSTARLTKDGSGEVIWQTSTKFVLKLTTAAGRPVVYKTYDRMRSLRYIMFHTSPLVNEALNYRRIGKLGLPLPKLLAVGEIRKFFWLKTGFLITEFAEGFRDGRDLMPRGAMGADKELRWEFCRRNLRRLAKLHDAGIFHRGFNPGNLLWRRTGAGDGGDRLELLWIDVANCRRQWRPILKRNTIHDLTMFFRYFDFTAGERRELMLEYLSGAKHPFYPADELVRRVEAKFSKYPAKY